MLEGHPGVPVAADILADNLKGETFYEARGFEPGETIEEQLGSELDIERRWWLRPAPDRVGWRTGP